jgi:hypothetical protein
MIPGLADSRQSPVMPDVHATARAVAGGAHPLCVDRI